MEVEEELEEWEEGGEEEEGRKRRRRKGVYIIHLLGCTCAKTAAIIALKHSNTMQAMIYSLLVCPLLFSLRAVLCTGLVITQQMSVHCNNNKTYTCCPETHFFSHTVFFCSLYSSVYDESCLTCSCSCRTMYM